jgi:glycosyltransferase involved in cell wall biosynthesis
MVSSHSFSVSLVITTYNRPDALALVLESVKRQSELPLEVLIADDGSGEATQSLIARYQSDFPVPLIHCWQEDDGFRAARARNIAIARASGDYIVMIDGDMVLHHYFICDHRSIARPNQFVQGRRVILTEKETQSALAENRIEFSLFSSGVKNKPNALSCPLLSPVISTLFSKKGYKSVRTCNMAVWRSDVISINGFNEGFVGWGREDSEFVVRLLNAGVSRKDLRFGGVAYHLYHQENSRNNLSSNDRLLEETINQHISYCQQGISQHLSQ